MTAGSSLRTDRAARVVSASPEAVSRALLEPDRLMEWLPPQGMSGRALLFDPRQGGRYRIELAYLGAGEGKTSAHTDVSSGRFMVIEPGRRIVMSVEFDSDDPRFAGEMIMTWELAAAQGGTRVTVTAENVPPGISAEDHAVGLASSLDNLAQCLARS